MSHFSVLVVTDERPSKHDLREVLLPYHEFECTGIERYLEWDDHTDEVTAKYAEPTKAYRAPDGRILSGHEDEFYREAIGEEVDKVGIGTGISGGVFFASKDWGDGRGHRPKVHHIPDGYEEIAVPQSQFYPSLAAFATEYSGYTVREDGRIGRMTNKNKRWDWYQVGGRYSGKLYLKPGHEGYRGERSWANEDQTIAGFDQCRRDALDFDAMKRKAVADRREWADDCCEKAKRSIAALETAIRALRVAHEEWLTLPEPRPRGGEYSAWLTAKGGDYEIAASFQKASFELPQPANGQSVEEWIAAAPAISAFAVVMDGQWYENGKMGFFGFVSDEKDDWGSQFDALFARVRPTQWVTIVDAHI